MAATCRRHKASRGFEPRSLDSESRELPVMLLWLLLLLLLLVLMLPMLLLILMLLLMQIMVLMLRLLLLLLPLLLLLLVLLLLFVLQQGKATGAPASRGPRKPQTERQDKDPKAARQPPPTERPSEQDELQVNLQGSLPEVLGKPPQGPAVDRVEPRPETGEAPSSSRLQPRVTPTPFRQKMRATEAVGSTHRAEEPTRHAAKMVRNRVPGQTRPQDVPGIAGNAETPAATSKPPNTAFNHQVGSKTGEAAKPTGRRPVRKQ